MSGVVIPDPRGGHVWVYGVDSAGEPVKVFVDPDGHLQVDVLTTALPAGAATQTTLAALLTELQLKADLTETQPVSLASVPTTAVTIADGSDVAEGAVADAVVAAGAAGTESAKLRRLTTDLDALLTELKLKADLTETQPVSAASLPLPAGAGTSANQTTMITALQLIDDLRNALGSVNTDDLQVDVKTVPADVDIRDLTPAQDGVLVWGFDGAAIHQIKTDAAGDLQVDVKTFGATTPVVYNVIMTTAATEYSQALPANTRKFLVKCRGAYDIKVCFTSGQSGTTYVTAPSGMAYWEDLIQPSSITLYFQCATAAQVAEIVAWS